MNVTPIKPSINVADTLRRIAEYIERGEFEGMSCTMVLATSASTPARR